MPLIYTAVFDAVSVSAITDLLWMTAPTDSIVELLALEITQDASITSEQLPLKMFRTATDNSAQGSSVTPNPIEVGFPAAGSTVRRTIVGANLSAETTMLWKSSQNVLNGWLWVPTPEQRIVLSPTAGTASRLAIKLATAPAAALTMSGTLWFQETGG